MLNLCYFLACNTSEIIATQASENTLKSLQNIMYEIIRIYVMFYKPLQLGQTYIYKILSKDPCYNF